MQPLAPFVRRTRGRPCGRGCGRGRRAGPSTHVVLFAVVLVSVGLTFFASRTEQIDGSLRTLPEEIALRQRVGTVCRGKKPIYVFVHLHKTAGNSLKHALFAFAKKNDLVLYHTCHKSRGDSSFTAWWFNRRKRAGEGLDCNLDDLVSLSVEERDRIDIVMGHQYVGVHTLFPHREVRYFTFVRNPLARKVSHFLHFERHNPYADLSTYLLERNRNYMTKRLATASTTSEVAADLRGRFVDVDNFAARAALRAAKRNIADRFFFVGVQERYTESVCVLARILNAACGQDRKLARVGMKAEKVIRWHENEQGETGRVIDNLEVQVKDGVKRAEGADWKLYRYATALFEEKLTRYPECIQITN